MFLQKSKIQTVGKRKKMYISVISFQEFVNFHIWAFSENVQCFVEVFLDSDQGFGRTDTELIRIIDYSLISK